MSHTLHNYFRSSTSIRVRIALAMKGIEYEYQSYALLNMEHQQQQYLALNPQGLVPTLVTPSGTITQSIAIIEYLEEAHPEPPLLPVAAIDRARVRALAHIVALDIHPLNNLRILQYLKNELQTNDHAVKKWFQHWAIQGFSAIEARLTTESETGSFCHGDAPTMADICLVSQAINNRRFDIPIAQFPTINRIVDRCLDIESFQKAMPDAQPDAIA